MNEFGMHEVPGIINILPFYTEDKLQFLLFIFTNQYSCSQLFVNIFCETLSYLRMFWLLYEHAGQSLLFHTFEKFSHILRQCRQCIMLLYYSLLSLYSSLQLPIIMFWYRLADSAAMIDTCRCYADCQSRMLCIFSMICRMHFTMDTTLYWGSLDSTARTLKFLSKNWKMIRSSLAFNTVYIQFAQFFSWFTTIMLTNGNIEVNMISSLLFKKLN